MLFKSSGIIFRATKYSETSLILDVYSEEKGLVPLIISGVRKSSAKTNAGIFRPLNILEFVAYNKSGDSLSRIKEAKIHYKYVNIGFETIRSSIGLFMIDIARSAIRERKDPNPVLYQFLFNWLTFLDTYTLSISNLHLVFLTQFIQELGFKIQNDHDESKPYFNLEAGAFSAIYNENLSLDESLSKELSKLLKTERDNLDELKLVSKIRSRLLDALIDFYRYHIEGFGKVKSLEVFRTVLS